jgi:hypothetical protein
MEYRFEVQPTDASGNPTGGWTPVMRNQIAPTEIGHWEHFPPLQSGKYTVNNPTPGPTERVATISADGWIQVPQENDVLSPAGAFSSNGNMINLITSTLASWGAVDQTGVLAGSSSTSNGSSLAQDRYFGIRMMVRQVGDLSNGSPAGTCVHIAIDDTTYNNVLHQPNWRHQLDPPGDLAVALVDIAELVAHPCAEIADKLTVLFTAAHPNLGAVSLSMVGPGGPYSFDMHPDGAATPQNFFGTATLHAPPTVSQLKPCAYLVTLEIQVLLTTGDAVPSDVFDQVAFCKG